MTSTGPAEHDGPEDQAYFRAVEEAFLALRGRTTLLGADDWQLARAWRRQGIPADLVVAVMESLFARQRERRSRRGISSLRYFRAAVDAAWDERLALAAGGDRRAAEPGPPVRRRLEGIAGALPAALAGVAELRDALLALEGDPVAVERSLEELDRRWLERLSAALGESERVELERRVERALARVSGAGAPEAERATLAGHLRDQAVRERFGLPVLSLFAPEALGGGEPEEEPPGAS